MNTIDDDVYVGSTTEALCKRVWKHKSDVKNSIFLTRPLYVKTKEYGFENFYIELIENYPCEFKEELVAREGYWIRQIGTLNALVAGRTGAEWRQENAEALTNKSQLYYREHHGEQLNKRIEWRDNNKDKKQEEHIRYREHNSYKVTCDKCGCLIQKKGMTKH